MDIISNTAKLRELLDGTVVMLKNNSPQDYLTKHVKGKSQVETANKRGFITILDYEENASFGYVNPNGGSLVTTDKPTYDRITCNYQYIQVGSEMTNETMANSANGSIVGASAQAAKIQKAAQRMVDMEEYYFCQGDGTQVLGRITGVNTGAVIPLAGTADGFGAYFLKKRQVIRIYDSTLTVLKGIRTITDKTSNAAITVDSVLAVVAGDLVLPQGDATTPTTTGIKGVPYIAGTDSGAYFDKSKTTNPNLAPIVDSTAGALSRTKLENIDQRHRIRNGRRMDTVDVTSPAQMSQYFTLMLTNATAHYVGQQRPAGDLGLDSWDYTWYGKRIREFRCMPTGSWFKLSLSDLCRVSLGDVGKMLTPAGNPVQKIESGAYVNAQQNWDDAYVEYFSANPAQHAALTNLTITSLPSLVNDKRV